MFLLRNFCAGGSIGVLVALALVFGLPALASTILASQSPWLPVAMLVLSFAGLFGIAYLATVPGRAGAGRPVGGLRSNDPIPRGGAIGGVTPVAAPSRTSRRT